MFLATSYKVTVRTGDVRGAGTDANVYILIFGKQGDTGRLPLRQSENTKNKFERGRADMFTVEAVDIGKVGVEPVEGQDRCSSVFIEILVVFSWRWFVLVMMVRV